MSTMHWEKDEYIHINGRPYVYTVMKDKSINVHFPGRVTIPLFDLMAKGVKIEMPKKIRERDLE